MREEENVAHDRKKRRVLSDEAPFLLRLGLVDDSGRPRPGRERKLAQVRRFVEILYHALPGAPTTLIECGSGRGYLSFAAHDLWQGNATVVGVERRQALVDEANDLATELYGGGTTPGTPTTLRFLHGDVEDFFQNPSALLSDAVHNNTEAVVVVALHACDSATDDALYAAVLANASAIFASPCCHKELRPQLDARVRELKRVTGRPLEPHESALLELGRHGLQLHKTAEMLTDTMRGLLLEIAGYDAPKMLEWVASDHTPRNTLLVATKKKKKGDVDALRARLRHLAAYYGITTHRLATCLGESLLDPSSETTTAATTKTTKTTKTTLVAATKPPPPRVVPHRMAPPEEEREHSVVSNRV
mmetsp:Transcript_1231/g.4144  ORF Transcript_1231/g.4144 Transcript_1231/m.4144 type:complete len:361 (-) Transcript_1231:76-1158(-)